MERLTMKDEKGNAFSHLSSGNALEIEELARTVVAEDILEYNLPVGYNVRGELIDRLAAYEDTGLTPEEVKTLKTDNDRLHRLIDELESGLRKENENENRR